MAFFIAHLSRCFSGSMALVGCNYAVLYLLCRLRSCLPRPGGCFQRFGLLPAESVCAQPRQLFFEGALEHARYRAWILPAQLYRGVWHLPRAPVPARLAGCVKLPGHSAYSVCRASSAFSQGIPERYRTDQFCRHRYAAIAVSTPYLEPRWQPNDRFYTGPLPDPAFSACFFAVEQHLV